MKAPWPSEICPFDAGQQLKAGQRDHVGGDLADLVVVVGAERMVTT